MADRRTAILDGALHVLAEQGMRGLTHRAVDVAADIPQGSTSYYFRSRSALVAGCIERIVELDFAIEGPLVSAVGDDVGALVDVLVHAAVSLVTTQRFRTLARYEVSLAAMRDPQLRAQLMRAGDTVRAFAAATLVAAVVVTRAVARTGAVGAVAAAGALVVPVVVPTRAVAATTLVVVAVAVAAAGAPVGATVVVVPRPVAAAVLAGRALLTVAVRPPLAAIAALPPAFT